MSLPWPGCYHSSADSLTIRVVKRYSDASVAIRLPLEPRQMRKRARYSTGDIQGRSTLANTDRFAFAPSPDLYLRRPSLPSSCVQRTNPGGDVSSARLGHADTRVRQEGLLGKRLSSLVAREDVTDIVSIVYRNGSPSTTTCIPLATWMTYDLSTVTEPSNPDHLFEECRILRRSAGLSLSWSTLN